MAEKEKDVWKRKEGGNERRMRAMKGRKSEWNRVV